MNIAGGAEKDVTIWIQKRSMSVLCLDARACSLLVQNMEVYGDKHKGPANIYNQLP
jgi:hypothetical protein